MQSLNIKERLVNKFHRSFLHEDLPQASKQDTKTQSVIEAENKGKRKRNI